MAYCWTVRDEKELEDVARGIKKEVPNLKFALYGDLGAGKTALTKAFSRIFKLNEEAESPTFGLLHLYQGADNLEVAHFDFYRLEDIEEAYDLGYEDYFYGENPVFVEWPEKIESLIPEHFSKIYIKLSADGSRSIRLEKPTTQRK